MLIFLQLLVFLIFLPSCNLLLHNKNIEQKQYLGMINKSKLFFLENNRISKNKDYTNKSVIFDKEKIKLLAISYGIELPLSIKKLSLMFDDEEHVMIRFVTNYPIEEILKFYNKTLDCAGWEVCIVFKNKEKVCILCVRNMQKIIIQINNNTSLLHLSNNNYVEIYAY